MDNSIAKSPKSLQTAWKWTLTKEALAPCFVRDALAMKESGLKGRYIVQHADFFWLGRVPCRSVLIVGVVVGIQVYEKRTVYSVDDGTGVIDCVLRHPTRQTVAPQSNKNNINTSRLAPVVAQKDPESHPPPPPPPVTEIGYAVRVAGKLMRRFETRQIMADTLEPCGPNLELFHWDHVKVLHETSYSLKDPFIIPAFPSRSPPRAYAQPIPPSNHIASPNSRFPAPSSPTGSSTAESISSSVASSPTKPSRFQSAPKLRHPSRLHSRDLTEITFRFYLKHYMDNAPSELQDNVTENLDDRASEEDVFQATPTKRRLSHTFHGQSLETPRPKHNNCAISTPRPPVQSPSISIPQHSRIHTSRRQKDTDPSSHTYGFTLSYLRRVPELALLASRVVRAEAKRRLRAEREEKMTRPTASSHSRTSSHAKPKQNEPSRLKMKRLFGWALVKLYEEGSIILWDGPVRKAPTGLSDSQDCQGETSALWKTANSTMFSVSSTSSSSVLALDEDEEDAQLSDPEENEESYVPLTPALLAAHVRHALQAMQAHPRGRGSGKEPSSEEVAIYLRRRDARWARVGAWVVKEAMDLVHVEGFDL
ncbi:hypothetical protein SERLADRAFT_433394 [Serpula lacrymans var. lacrymans S7.9]|uniref:CST complex subunit STN1 n=1 Tax=Serpula lacrymans var. lacrymans (strain S7.9) TaxID=578457 RepID=F8NGS8_SERL9|nr:uncharacterized protein SERLADRAFT_433394 [Serpula lacrymans var. lacrymans S7.9]EGO29410.1 hypothetical protein SERLADRAFT_433394 [Serpula lacrymans var. lacrymans S7.9]